MTGINIGLGQQPEVEVRAIFMKGCKCGEKHPMAYDPPNTSQVCLNPKCGAPVSTDLVESVFPAVITGKSMWFRIAKSFLFIASKLYKLADKVSK